MQNNTMPISHKADPEIRASAPCRIDMGGTLDISTFYLPLRHRMPGTFNIAMEHRTHVALRHYKPGKIRVVSSGFENAEFQSDRLPFNHPLGLMLAIVSYFDLDGLDIRIDSESPPRSGLGGSSSAAVALIAAIDIFLKKDRHPLRSKRATALLAHAVESSVAGVPCGLQDQLAAVFGGVNAWLWPGKADGTPYIRQTIIRPAEYRRLESHLLLAYCGSDHESRDVNGRWVRQFLSGERRKEWSAIADLSGRFIRAIGGWDVPEAVRCMNAETDIRMEMTPDVLNPAGRILAEAARKKGCGARFTGAGAGGCVWAIGNPDAIHRLRQEWKTITSAIQGARMLDVNIARRGVCVASPLENGNQRRSRKGSVNGMKEKGES